MSYIPKRAESRSGWRGRIGSQENVMIAVSSNFVIVSMCCWDLFLNKNSQRFILSINKHPCKRNIFEKSSKTLYIYIYLCSTATEMPKLFRRSFSTGIENFFRYENVLTEMNKWTYDRRSLSAGFRPIFKILSIWKWTHKYTYVILWKYQSWV